MCRFLRGSATRAGTTGPRARSGQNETAKWATEHFGEPRRATGIERSRRPNGRTRGQVAKAADAKKGGRDNPITAMGRRRRAALDPWVAERAPPKLEARRRAAEAVVVVAVEPELRVLDQVAEARVQVGEDRLLLRLR